MSSGRAIILARGEFAGLGFREPDAIDCARGPGLVTDTRGIGSVGGRDGATGFCSLTLESDDAESRTSTAGRVDTFGR